MHVNIAPKLMTAVAYKSHTHSADCVKVNFFIVELPVFSYERYIGLNKDFCLGKSIGL